MPPAVPLAAPSTPDATTSDERAVGLPDDAAADDAWLGITRWSTTPDGRREGLTAMSLSGLYCAACAGTIEQALSAVPGVLAAQVHYGQASAEIRWDPLRTRPEAWTAAIRAAGYRCAPDAVAPTRALRLQESRQSLWRLFVAGFCMMQVMMYATPAYVAAPGDLEPDLARLLQWACWLLSIPVVLFSAGPFFRAALQQLRQGRPGMDVPVALGVAVTFVVSTGATFDPGGIFGHEVYFDSLTMFVAFLLGGRWLELRARHRAASAMESMVARRSETALRVDDHGAEVQVPVAALRVGDRVRVRAGEALPADGEVIEGRSATDESMLTGESRPVDKATGDSVLAGSLNLLGPLLVRVLQVGADTRHEAIVALMRGALAQRPALMRAADRIAVPFLWTVLLLAGLGAAAWSVIDPSRAVWVAVSVLIVTCPCALALAAPSALLASAGALSRRGVLLRRLDAVEALARLDLLFLDKTGTLTEDRLALVAVHRLDDGAAATAAVTSDLQAMAAALAARSLHPLSQSLKAAMSADGTTVVDWRDVQEHAGLGLEALDADGRAWRLGSAAWLAGAAGTRGSDAGVAVSSVWFGPVGRPLLRFDFDERLREDVPAAIATLRARGIELRLLSGDTPARVQRMAERLGLAVAAAGATPELKLRLLQAARAEGHVVGMVGDGLNDAPVLAAADVSFAMGQGAALARTQADAVLLSGRLDAVAFAHQQAGRTMRVMRQGFGWAIAYNLTCIPLALLGWLPPWAAGLGMATSSLGVVINALRLVRVPADPDRRLTPTRP